MKQRYELRLTFAPEPFVKDGHRRKSTYRRKLFRGITLKAAQKILSKSRATGSTLITMQEHRHAITFPL